MSDVRFDKSEWHPGDAEWMNIRKSEWRHVYQSLMDMPSGRPMKDHFPYLKEYFFFGKEFGPAYKIPFLIKLWFYPGDLETVLASLLTNTTEGELDSARRWFFRNAYSGKYNTSDGMMHGREKAIARFYFPAEYTDTVLNLDDGYGGKKAYNLCWLPPDRFIQDSLMSLCSFLEKPKKCNPFTPYQYLLDHLFSCIAHIQGDLDDLCVEHFFRVLQAHKPSRWRALNVQNSNKLAQKFLERLAAPDVDERLKALWDQAKQKEEED